VRLASLPHSFVTGRKEGEAGGGRENQGRSARSATQEAIEPFNQAPRPVRKKEGKREKKSLLLVQTEKRKRKRKETAISFLLFFSPCCLYLSCTAVSAGQ